MNIKSMIQKYVDKADAAHRRRVDSILNIMRTGPDLIGQDVLAVQVGRAKLESLDSLRARFGNAVDRAALVLACERPGCFKVVKHRNGNVGMMRGIEWQEFAILAGYGDEVMAWLGRDEATNDPSPA